MSMTRDERSARIDELKRWFEEQNEEFRDDGFTPEVQAAWDANVTELKDHERVLENLKQRDDRLREMAKEGTGDVESGDGRTADYGSHAPQLISRMTERQVYDLSQVRVDAFNPGRHNPEIVNRARRAIELAYFPAAGRDQERVREHVDGLLRHGSDEDLETNAIALRVLATGAPAYRRAFSKILSRSMSGAPMASSLNQEEGRALERAMSMTGSSGAEGGYAVPFELDPTIVPTSNSTVNPYRAACRVVQITGNEWRGVTSAGITANYGYQAEVAPAVEATGPVLAQPAFVTKRATAFVPVSIELTQDWGSLQSELGTMIQDAKDDLEAAQFTNGVGTTVFPQGILVGATTTVSAGTGLTIVAQDIYNTEVALGPRFRPRAQWISNRYFYNRVRAIDTAGGAQLWQENLRVGLPNNVPTPGNLNSALLGYPTNEASAFPAAAPLTNGMKLALLGDLRYYVIVDRIGLDIEIIPHLTQQATAGAGVGMPTGQRGFYAFWRNYAAVINANAFRVLTATT